MKLLAMDRHILVFIMKGPIIMNVTKDVDDIRDDEKLYCYWLR